MRVKSWITYCLILAAVTATGCVGQKAFNLPPAQQMMHPGPGVGGPGPGVIPVGGQMTAPMSAPASYGPGGTPPMSGVTPCQYCEDGSCMVGGGGGGGCAMGAGGASQIHFVGEEGLQIAWDVSGAGMFDSTPLFVPGRQDFPQGAIYRLRLTNIPGRAGVTLYPTLEVAPVTPRTDAFLAHAPIPVQFTEEDFDQVMSGNFVTKVIYLPDPEFQELALSGVETLVSTRLDPGVDPVSEADRRGSILAVLRIGSKDLRTAGGSYGPGVIPAGYGDNCNNCGPQGGVVEGPMMDGGYVDGGYESGQYAGEGYVGQGVPANQPSGMPTAGMAPPAVPPHMIAGMNPQYGMPYSGTPIGLPGPPHIPLGSPAGLRSHVMKNRTRVHMPPPTPQMQISVKQRPGLNYPKPVNKVMIDEVHRAPFRPIGGTVPNPAVEAAARIGAKLPSGGHRLSGQPLLGSSPRDAYCE